MAIEYAPQDTRKPLAVLGLSAALILGGLGLGGYYTFRSADPSSTVVVRQDAPKQQTPPPQRKAEAKQTPPPATKQVEPVQQASPPTVEAAKPAVEAPKPVVPPQAPSPKVVPVKQVVPSTAPPQYNAILTLPVGGRHDSRGDVYVAPKIMLYEGKPTLYFNAGSQKAAQQGHYSHYGLRVRDKLGNSLAQIVTPIGQDARLPISRELKQALEDQARFEVWALEQTAAEPEAKFTRKASYRNAKFDAPSTEAQQILQQVAVHQEGTKLRGLRLLPEYQAGARPDVRDITPSATTLEEQVTTKYATIDLLNGKTERWPMQYDRYLTDPASVRILEDRLAKVRVRTVAHAPVVADYSRQ